MNNIKKLSNCKTRECIRISAVLLQPFIPDTCDNIFKQINTDIKDFSTLDKFGYYNSNKVGNAEVLFKRVEVYEKM